MKKMDTKLTEQHVLQMFILNRDYTNKEDNICVKSIYGTYYFSKDVLSKQSIITGYLNQTELKDSCQVFQVGENRKPNSMKWWTIDLDKIDMLLSLGVAVGELEYMSNPVKTDITKLYVKRVK